MTVPDKSNYYRPFHYYDVARHPPRGIRRKKKKRGEIRINKMMSYVALTFFF